MDTSTGTFTSMDTYAGSVFDPVSLHKYLYANANPITYSDPSGNSADINSLNAGMTGFAILSVSDVIADLSIMAIGYTLIHSLKRIEIKSYSQVTKLIFEFAQETVATKTWSNFEFLLGIKRKLGAKSKNVVIASSGSRKDGDKVYYHATTLANALLIMSSKTLLGSSFESYHVFAWGLIPDKKALKYSGAYSAEVIVAFSTYAAFEDDPGIIDQYVLMYQPKRSVLAGAVHANKVVILPIV